jgi:hypothetical protein
MTRGVTIKNYFLTDEVTTLSPLGQFKPFKSFKPFNRFAPFKISAGWRPRSELANGFKVLPCSCSNRSGRSTARSVYLSVAGLALLPFLPYL